MTQTPITITYTLEEILGQINQRLGNIERKLTKVQEGIADLKIEQIRMENELKREIRSVGEKLNR